MGNENATTAPKTTSDDLADDVNRAEDVAEQSADNPSELPKDHECTRAELIHLPPDESVFNESDLLTEMKCIPRLRSKSLPVLFNLDSEDLLGNYHGRDAPKKCRSLPDVFNIEKEIISLSESSKVNSGGTHDEEGESFAAEGDVQMTNQDHSSKTQKIKLIGRSKSLPGYDTLDLANDHENENSAITKPLTKPTRKLHRSLSLPTILEEIPFSIVKEQPFEKMKLNSELEKLAVLNEEEDDEEKAPCVNIRNVEFQEIVTKDLDKPDVRNDNNDCTSRILATSVGDNQSKLIDSILAAESGENSETPGGCMENQGIYLDEVKDKMSTAIASVDTIVTNGRSAKLDESDKKEAGEDVAERLKAMTQVDWDLPLIQRPRVNTLPLTEYMERIPELPEKDSPIWETTTKGMIHAFSLTPPKGKELDNHKRRSWPMDMRDIKQNPVESASKEDLIFVQTQCHKEDLTKDQGSKHEMLDDTDGLRMPSTEQDHDALLTLWKSHASSYPDTLDLNLMRKPGHEFAETHHMEKLEEENEEEDRKESDAFNANKSLSYDELLDDFEEKFSRAVSYYTEPDFTQSLSSIHREIANGSVERLIALIDSGADVNAPDEHGYPPLHVAVVSGQVDCADCLIRAGADLEGYTEALVNEFYALRDEGRQYNGRAIFI
ncbi:predicted protein [Nematostella vectensis]|uniref:Uncharacterized protein n=2 Tax=Nematostella vectensis TaxID=45351 RepID=A7SAN8_NEMVE|nr:predicted protein [Nematostella vectensis]|eukprot:XP_001631289.1 predicted protein [Nematostella vectensis]